MEEKTINNELYNELGDRWYTAYDDPVALLRAENKIKIKWILERLNFHFAEDIKILDIACGAGFLTNELALRDFQVCGVDLSQESLEVAKRYDKTKSVNYQNANAYSLPFSDNSFECVTCMDFLEHVENPAKVISEASRVLKPGGLFFYHTFNRNYLSGLVIIKGVEWFVKNTPKNMHLLKLFIKPNELIQMCKQFGMNNLEITGIRPKFESKAFWKLLFTREVPKDFSFALTKSLMFSYLGVAKK